MWNLEKVNYFFLVPLGSQEEAIYLIMSRHPAAAKVVISWACYRRALGSQSSWPSQISVPGRVTTETHVGVQMSRCVCVWETGWGRGERDWVQGFFFLGPSFIVIWLHEGSLGNWFFFFFQNSKMVRRKFPHCDAILFARVQCPAAECSRNNFLIRILRSPHVGKGGVNWKPCSKPVS